MRKERFVSVVREMVAAHGRIENEEGFAKELGELFEKMTPKKVMAIGPFCWGRATTLPEAVKFARSQWSSSYAGKFSQSKLHLFAVSDDASVDDMGGLSATTIITLQEPERKKKGAE